jgi:hypothetical protein
LITRAPLRDDRFIDHHFDCDRAHDSFRSFIHSTIIYERIAEARQENERKMTDRCFPFTHHENPLATITKKVMLLCTQGGFIFTLGNIDDTIIRRLYFIADYPR